MSHKAVKWALGIPKLRPPVKLVLVVLAEHADDRGGSCHPGITTLAEQASTSRRRVIEAIRELEELGAIRVHRSMAETGKRRAVNHYFIAVGKLIEVPKDKAAKLSDKGAETGPYRRPNPSDGVPEKGTNIVPLGNHVGSPGYTGTTTEPPINHHSEPKGSARLASDPRTRGSVAHERSFPDHAMISACEDRGVDPDHLAGTIENYRTALSEAALDGDPKAQEKYRTIWFATLAGQGVNGVRGI